MKKAISAATSAALLASLLATAVAPAALASVTTTSAGNIAIGHTSTGTVTFRFTERSANPLPSGSGSFDLVIEDVDGGSTVSFSGTPVVAAPDSLDASASILGDTLTVSWDASDTAHTEWIEITGLKIAADSDAALGPVSAYFDSGDYDHFFSASDTATATGVILASDELLAGADTADIRLTSVCEFRVTGGLNAKATFSDVADARDITAADPYGATQSLTFAAGSSAHAAGVIVTQTVENCAPDYLPDSVGMIVDSADYTSDGNPTVFPGESNSEAADLNVYELSAGFLTEDTTLTFTISTAGVVFSHAPDVSWDYASGDCTLLEVSDAVLSGDRKSATVTVTSESNPDATAGTTAGGEGGCSDPGMFDLHDIHYDVAASVPGGTFVTVGLALSGGLLVNPTTNTNAVVFRGIDASAPTPTVYIGENNQATGLITLTEQAAGFFQSGTGTNNVLEVCDRGTDFIFTFAPWAKVTNGTLRLREGDTLSPDNIVEGTYSSDGCYTWTVWTASTTASTIVIGNSTFTSGPLINVDVDQAPGIVALGIYSGNGATYTTYRIATVGFAVAAYRNQVVVTALAQPFIPAGAKSRAGAIQIAETANGQIKAHEHFCVEILPRTSNIAIQDTFMQALTTADLPVVTATGGLIVGPVSMTFYGCDEQISDGGPSYVGPHAVAFHFDILQQSTNGTGKAVIDNINLITTADAPSGPVLFTVYGFGGSPTSLEFQSTISPAKIGVEAPPKLHLRNVVVNDNGGTATVANFTLKADSTTGTGSNSLLGISPVDSGAGLVADTWTLSQAGPVGYAASAWVCIGGTQVGSKITVANAGEATCTITNNDIATLPKLNIKPVSALGLNPTSGYTTKTPKTQAVGKYITWKFTGGTALAGQRVNVLVAKKINGAWGGPVYLKSAWADANGIVTFARKSNTAAAINVRVQWPAAGSATYAVSTSKALGGYWK